MSKNNKEAEKCRAAGNKLFFQGNYCEAILAYNHSLCYAETGSEAVGLGYGNRSAVYFRLEEYELCLSSIEMAKANG